MPEKRKGIVLIGVLALIILLMAVLMEFTYRSKVQLDVAHHALNSARVRMASDSVLDITKALLAHAIDMDAPELAGLFDEGVSFLLGEVEVDISIEPESAKFNLNRLVDGRGNLRNQEVRLLFRLADLLADEYEEPVLTYDMVMSILEWITPEDATDILIGAFPGEPAGSEYYLGKTPPYECKHNRFNSISELLLVKGITEQEFLGRPSREDREAIPGLLDLLTLYGNSIGIRQMLRREGVTMEDIGDIAPQTHETYLTINVEARKGSSRHLISAVVGRDGPRVVELSRFER